MTMMFLKLNMIKDVLLAGVGGWLRNVAMAFVFLGGLFSAGHSASAADPLAGLLAYEGFEYPTGNSLPGQGVTTPPLSRFPATVAFFTCPCP
jgi:hypothetical protein